MFEISVLKRILSAIKDVTAFGAALLKRVDASYFNPRVLLGVPCCYATCKVVEAVKPIVKDVVEAVKPIAKVVIRYVQAEYGMACYHTNYYLVDQIKPIIERVVQPVQEELEMAFALRHIYLEELVQSVVKRFIRPIQKELEMIYHFGSYYLFIRGRQLSLLCGLLFGFWIGAYVLRLH